MGALGVLVVLLVVARILVRPLALLEAGVAIAEAFAPLVTRLERRVPHVAAVLLVYLVALCSPASPGWLCHARSCGRTDTRGEEGAEFPDRVKARADGVRELCLSEE